MSKEELSNLKLASRGLRFGGWMVDILLWLVVWLGGIWWLVSARTIAQLLDSLLIVVSLGLTGVVLSLLQAGLTSSFGGTIGKLIFGIEVVGEDGKRLTFWRALWREWFGAWVSSAALWLGFIWILIDKHRRGWHDMMAGSQVVVRRNSGLVIGLTALIMLLVVNGFILNNIIGTVSKNIPFYNDVFSDAMGSLKNNETKIESIEEHLPEPTPNSSPSVIPPIKSLQQNRLRGTPVPTKKPSASGERL